MDAYCEITLLPNPEIGRNFLWSKVYQQIHLGLVPLLDQQGRSPIGVAFPDYSMAGKHPDLGARCRLFAPDETTLQHFDPRRCLARLADYVHCTSIRSVPGKVTGYATFQRLQAKTNPERLARRYAKRHGLDLATAFHNDVDVMPPEGARPGFKSRFRYAEMEGGKPMEPFIRLKSLSGGGNFRLWVKRTPRLEATPGGFTSYGLSASTTVPEF